MVNGQEGGLSFAGAWLAVQTSVSRMVQRVSRGLGARIAADGIGYVTSGMMRWWQLVTCVLPRNNHRQPPSWTVGRIY